MEETDSVYVAFFVVIGFIWFFSGFNDGILRKMDDTLDLCEEDKARNLLEHFNVSKDQLHALASLFSESDQIRSLKCTKESSSGMQPNDGTACALMVCSDKQEFKKHHAMVSENENVEPQDQCPVRDESIPTQADLSMKEEKLQPLVLKSFSPSISSNHQNCEERVLQTSSLRDIKKHCEVCFMKVCWLILLGLALSCKIPCLVLSLWRNQNQTPIQQQQAQDSSKSPGTWRTKLLVMFVLVGVVGSIWLFFHLHEKDVFRRTETLSSMCDERARMLQDQFNVSMNHVHALAILVSTFYHGKEPSAIDQKTFGEYTEKTAFERPLTSGVAYALRVLDSEREQFEKHNGWTIKKMRSEDQTLVQDCIPEDLDPSPIQDEYAPVILSQETVSHIVSIDMMSGKEDRENILRARASGKGVLTSPFPLLKSNHLGVVLTFAVYNVHLPPDAMPEERINATVGYLGASYDVPSLVDKLLHQLARKQKIVVNVYDSTNKSSPIQMYGSNDTATGLLKISNLDFGDPARMHEMHCSFKHKPSPPWTAIVSSVGCLVITLLLGHIFYAAINRIAKVEQDYRWMMELRHRAEAADVAKSQALQFLATVFPRNLDSNEWCLR